MVGMAKKKTNNRAKSSKHVVIDIEVHKAITQLAEKNRRPVSWEIEGILIEAAKAAGLWPPKEE